jgi:hypothetical protein
LGRKSRKRRKKRKRRRKHKRRKELDCVLFMCQYEWRPLSIPHPAFTFEFSFACTCAHLETSVNYGR